MTTCPDCKGEGGFVVAYPEIGMHPEECRTCGGTGHSVQSSRWSDARAQMAADFRPGISYEATQGHLDRWAAYIAHLETENARLERCLLLSERRRVEDGLDAGQDQVSAAKRIKRLEAQVAELLRSASPDPTP